MITIEKVDNGYILRGNHWEEVYSSLEGVFDRLLLAFDGRSKHFSGDHYGEVSIVRGKAADEEERHA